jgi:DNA processing protein
MSGQQPPTGGAHGYRMPATVAPRPAPAVGAATGRPAAEVLRARAYLSRVAEPPAPALAAFVEVLGPVAAAAQVRSGDVPGPVAGETAARRTTDRADADLEAAHEAGARLLVPEDAAWPRDALAPCLLAGVPTLAPPVALWVRGPRQAAELSARAVAVVGARAATSYGTHVAGELGAGLAAAGATVVSGAAIGIDGAAHRGCLAVDGATVAALACGVDRAYPAAHSTLLERIAATGLVVSEYPPGSVPARHRFLVRNRLIAALGAGTVVVEAALRSGAQRTAADTEALGRVVMAVPGPVTSGPSAGCHQLIRDGALLVTSADDVLEAVGRLGVDLAPEPDRPARRTDGLGRAAALVHDALPARGGRDTRWLARESGLPPDGIRAALTELERRGLARCCDGMWQLARPGGEG